MALAELDALIHKANTNGSDLYLIFFDIENAFPRVWRHRIPTTLHKYGLRGLLPRLLESFLAQRSFQVRVAKQSSSVQTQDNGIPQGSSLRGTPFLVAINDIFRIVEFSVKTILFADDLTAFIFKQMTVRERTDYYRRLSTPFHRGSTKEASVSLYTKLTSIFSQKNQQTSPPTSSSQIITHPTLNNRESLGATISLTPFLASPY